MSRNSDIAPPSIGITRIVPACSTMNSRRVPSRAPVTNTGLTSPCRNGDELDLSDRAGRMDESGEQREGNRQTRAHAP